MSRGIRKTRVGVVISDKMDKTVTIEVRRNVLHPLYKKYIRRRSKLHAHDESNSYHVGDRVRVIEARPLSKTKRWRVQEKIT